MMYSSKVIKISDAEEDGCKSFSLKRFHTGSGLKNKKALKDAGIYYDLNDEEINSVKDLLQKVKMDAEKILADAKAEASLIKKQAQKSGFEEGKSKGLNNAMGIFETAVNAFQNAAADIRNKNDNFAVDHQDTLIKLSLSIARKIMNREISANQEFVIDTIKSAVKLTMDREKLKVRVHPEDLDLCNQKLPDLSREIDGIKKIEMVADVSVNKGGAIVEYAMGEIDARIEKQFLEIENEIINNS